MKNIIIDCYCTSTRTRTTQHCVINGVHGKAYFYNRPYERYDYQKAIIDALQLLHASPANIRYVSDKCHTEKQARDYLRRYLRIAA